jgi:hypothetical protein
MWPFRKKSIDIQPGEAKYFSLEIPSNVEIGNIILNYDDEHGNKYESKILVDFKDKKILRQSYRIIKQVKFIPEEDRPKLVIDEKDLEMYLKSKKNWE